MVSAYDSGAEPTEEVRRAKEEALNAVRELLENKFQICAAQVHSDSDLVRDLSIDPSDVEDIALALEETFEIDISNFDAERIFTVGDAVKCVLRSRGR